jgi:hypothetical protein
MKRIIGSLVSVLILLVIAWFVFGGRISYALAECSMGVRPCMVGIAVALGIVDVYDKKDRCIGVGCNM